MNESLNVWIITNELGQADGVVDGWDEGDSDGTELGWVLGIKEGRDDGAEDIDGATLGLTDGSADFDGL